MWAIGVGLGYLLGIRFNLGLPGVWIAFAIDEWFRGILVLIRWKRGKWRGESLCKLDHKKFITYISFKIYYVL